MLKHSRFLLFVLPILLLLGACHSTPDHAKYIPKNALMVAEINTKELSKKIAWDMISSSNMWDKLKNFRSKKDSAKQAEFIKNMTEAGVDELNTFYAYIKNLGADNNDVCFVALIPLKDASKWESFVKKTFTDAGISEGKKRKEAKLDDNMYAGWTNNLLILISLKKNQSYNYYEDAQIAGSQNNDLLLASHLESAFNVTEENSLLNDKRFAAFEKDKHDLGFWVNVDAVMSSYGNKNIGSMTGGLSMANTMWRNSAFSAATHFEKGKIETDFLMYSSDEMKEINDKYSNKNVDDEMLGRIESKNLDYALAYHLSPEGTQKTIEKMGMLGLANGYLKDQDLSIEEILTSITGDFIVSMNNFSQTKETILFDSNDPESAFSSYKTDLDLVFALKLKNKSTFQKILNLAIKMNMLEQINAEQYKMKMMGSSDSSVIFLNENYALFANKNKLAQQFLAKNSKAVPSNLIKENIAKHPFGMFFDYNNWAKRMSPLMAATPSDSVVYAASLKTFDHIIFNGGTNNNNTFKYKLSVELVDKNESSLVQLLNFGKAMQEAELIREKEAENIQKMISEASEEVEF